MAKIFPTKTRREDSVQLRFGFFSVWRDEGEFLGGPREKTAAAGSSSARLDETHEQRSNVSLGRFLSGVDPGKSCVKLRRRR